VIPEFILYILMCVPGEPTCEIVIHEPYSSIQECTVDALRLAKQYWAEESSDAMEYRFKCEKFDGKEST